MNTSDEIARRNEQNKRRADDAQRLLSHPLMIEAFSTMRESCYNSIDSSKPDDKDSREFIYCLMQATKLFESCFKKIIRDGKTDDMMKTPTNIMQR